MHAGGLNTVQPQTFVFTNAKFNPTRTFPAIRYIMQCHASYDVQHDTCTSSTENLKKIPFSLPTYDYNIV